MNAERAAGPAGQKKIKSKHNNLLNYFIHDRRDLSPAYVRSCEKYLEEKYLEEISRKLQAAMQQDIIYSQRLKKIKKNKSASSRVGPPNKVKGSKLQG